MRFNSRTATPTQRLRLRNIYVLPTRSGMMLGVTMVLLLITSINFRLNLGYALTFLIAGAAFASTFTAFRTLRSLKLSIQRVPAVFMGDDLTFSVIIENPDQRTRYGIGIAINEYKLQYTKNNWVWCDVLPKESTSVALAILTHQRGWHQLPELVIQTHFPMGVFRTWSVWQPSTQALVYPTLEKDPPVLPSNQHAHEPDQLEQGRAIARKHQAEEFDGIRPYRAGDPMKRIYWKKVLSSGDLLTRETSSIESADLWLTLESTGLSHIEAQLSRLAAWVLLAHKQGISYGLKLGSQSITPAEDESHQLKCLQALATLHKEGVQRYKVQKRMKK